MKSHFLKGALACRSLIADAKFSDNLFPPEIAEVDVDTKQVRILFSSVHLILICTKQGPLRELLDSSSFLDEALSRNCDQLAGANTTVYTLRMSEFK